MVELVLLKSKIGRFKGGHDFKFLRVFFSKGTTFIISRNCSIVGNNVLIVSL
jgi:hypothetical protein